MNTSDIITICVLVATTVGSSLLIAFKVGGLYQRFVFMDGRMTSVEGRMTSVEGRVTSLEGRMTSLEGRMTSVEDRMTSLEGRMTSLEGRMTSVEDRMTSLEGRMTSLERKMDSVVEQVNYLTISIGQVLFKLDALWEKQATMSNSPKVLNETGLKILETSRISDFANQNYDEILLRVKETTSENAYQAQQALISVVSMYQDDDTWRLKLEESAFHSGCDVGTLLFVAAMSIRDRIISDLGFNQDGLPLLQLPQNS